jgi:hypothetical protein
MGEQDEKISLLQRLVEHATNTARYSIYYGEGRDAYDVCGRTAHEAIFNVTKGIFRCPNSQQGYSPFSTWTRGLAWAICGFAEQLEYIQTLSPAEWEDATARDWAKRYRELFAERPRGRRLRFAKKVRSMAKGSAARAHGWFVKAARATADFYLANVCTDGVPMWDTGAPNLHRLGDYASKPADPFNSWEPVDSSAAAIAAQGLMRLGNHLTRKGEKKNGVHYRQAGLTIAKTLLEEPYLALRPKHQGLLLHSVYHRPNGWDYVAPGQRVPNGESSMWGDYHVRELALLLWREAKGERYLTFFDGTS